VTLVIFTQSNRDNIMAFGDFTVTRASTKLRIGSNGLYGSVANNVPAFEFNTDGSYRGLLVEPGASNFALHSQDFTQAAWNKTVSASVTGNTGVAPDGTTTADTFTAGANGSQLQQSYVGTAGVTYTASFFIRRVTGTGTVSIRSVENVNTPITITSSWARYSLAVTSTTTTIRIGLVLATSGDEIEIWQAQLETGSVATSPIVTTAGTASRVADVITLTSASSLIGQTANTLYVEGEIQTFTGASDACIFALTDGTSDDAIVIGTVAANGRIEAVVRDGGSDQATIASGSFTTGVFKCAIASAVNDVAFYLNGSSVGTDTSATHPALSVFQFGGTVAVVAPTARPVWFRAIADFPTRIANATLVTLTTL
jgi:hypothetical protein